MEEEQNTELQIEGFAESIRALQERVASIAGTLVQQGGAEAVSPDDQISQSIPELRDAIKQVESSLSMFKSLINE